MELLFWICLFVVFYTYIGYGILLYLLVLLKRRLSGRSRRYLAEEADALWPTCTVVVAAYNEEAFIDEKIRNTLALHYPKDRVRYLFVTDGSSDGTAERVTRYPELLHLHSPERKGKIAAIHRAMAHVDSDLVVFTDANTLLNPDALRALCRHYADPRVGAVAGEKRVYAGEVADASAAGEGLYWKYESALKRWDSELYSVVGSAGELFSIRYGLYEPVPDDTVLDDFMISMRIAERGYRVVYEPDAFATEMASENVQEELKRKIRIAAGGWQSILRLRRVLNPLANPVLTFQYISHRVLRWTITPILLIVVFLLNAWLYFRDYGLVYSCLFWGQVVFYVMALIGYVLEQRSLKVKLVFVPYYFCVMNYAVLAGMIRYFRGGQSAVWERANRRLSGFTAGSR